MHAFARAGLSNAWQWLPCPSQIGVLCCANAQTLTPKTVCCQTTKLFNNNPESFTPYPGLIWGTSIIYHIYIYMILPCCATVQWTQAVQSFSCCGNTGMVLKVCTPHSRPCDGKHALKPSTKEAHMQSAIPSLNKNSCASRPQRMRRSPSWT